MRVLIFGLPGSGKTYLAERLVEYLGDKVAWFNADKVREEANDWDFSEMGRSIQTNRMKRLADEAIQNNRNVIADFVCPTEHTREDFNADYIIWMDTIKESKFEDTNKMFEEPKNFDFKVTHKDAQMFSFLIKQEILDKLKGLGPHD